MRHFASVLVLGLSVLGACTRTSYPTPAANLTSPAPRATVGTPAASHGNCTLFPIRAERLPPSDLVHVLGQQVPTRLPDGFGLLDAWASSEQGGSHGAIWLDAGCRQVILEVWPNAAASESPMPNGRWLLQKRSTCFFGSLCLDYRAHSDGAVVELSFVGLSQGEASWVVSGVHV